MIHRSSAVTSLIIIFCSIFLISCGKGPDIILGFSALLSGSAAALGVEEHNAVVLAVDSQNQAGGLLGRSISLVSADDRNTIEYAIAEDLRLIAQGASVIIGHAQSSMVPAIEEVMDTTDMLYISPTIASMALSRRDDRFIRTIPGLETQGISIASDALQNGLLTAACLYDTSNASFSYGVVDVFRDTFIRGGGTVDFLQPFDPIRIDHDAMADTILASGVSMVLLSCSAGDVIKLAAALARSGKTPPALYGPNWARTTDLLSAELSGIEGMRFASIFESDPPTAQAAVFKAQYQERYGAEPGFAAYAAWEAVQILFTAIESTGSTSPEDIKRFIIGQSIFEGIHSPIRIDQYGDAHKPSLVVELREGAFKRVGVYQ